MIKSVFHQCSEQVGYYCVVQDSGAGVSGVCERTSYLSTLGAWVRTQLDAASSIQDPASRLIGSRALRATMMNGRSAFIDSVNAKYRSGRRGRGVCLPRAGANPLIRGPMCTKSKSNSRAWRPQHWCRPAARPRRSRIALLHRYN